MTTFILALDPGVADLGYALLEDHPAGAIYRSMGVERTTPSLPDCTRYDVLTRFVDGIVTSALDVSAIAMEAYMPYRKVRAGKAGFSSDKGENVKFVIGAVRAIGLIRRIPVVEYTASAVKGVVTQDRYADKVTVQAAVARYFGWATLPKPEHAADAVAVGLAHYVLRGQTGAVYTKVAGRALLPHKLPVSQRAVPNKVPRAP